MFLRLAIHRVGNELEQVVVAGTRAPRRDEVGFHVAAEAWSQLAIRGESEVAVIFHHDESVALHAADRL